MTARAVGRVFGSLANGGLVEAFDPDTAGHSAAPLVSGHAAGSTLGGGGKKGSKADKHAAGGTTEGSGASKGCRPMARFLSGAGLAAWFERVAASCDPSTAPLPHAHPDGTFPELRARMTCGFFPW